MEELGERRRPFAPGVAEQLVDNLRQVRVPGQETTIAGQYVEPVQLQVVCYQLWENLERGTGEAGIAEQSENPDQSNQSNPSDKSTPEITLTDLAAAGDVDQALTQFYEETLAFALADPAAAGISERQLRAWFDGELITEAGARGLVHQGKQESGGLPNGCRASLAETFLSARRNPRWRRLDRAGARPVCGADPRKQRGVVPSASERACSARPRCGMSKAAPRACSCGTKPWPRPRRGRRPIRTSWTPNEQAFLAACREAQKAAERERRQSRRIRMLAVAAVVISILAIGVAIFAWTQTQKANASAELASANAKLAQDRIAQVGKAVGDLGIERLLSMASQLDEAGDTSGATTLLATAVSAKPALLTDLNGDTLTADSCEAPGIPAANSGKPGSQPA